MSIEHQQFEEESRILKALEQSLNVQTESLETQHHLYGVLREILEGTAQSERIAAKSLQLLEQIAADLASEPTLSTSISFKEITMNPTAAGQTQVFTGTLSPSGSVLAPDAVATVTSNDPAVAPTLDSTQLVVSVTYPDGWVESTTTPLAFTYATTSATTSQALSATITPSAPPPPPPVLATSIGFEQTT